LAPSSRWYSKVNKSTRAKLAVIFVHFRCSVVSCALLQQSKIEFARKQIQFLIIATIHKNTKLEVGKSNCHLLFAPVDLSFELAGIYEAFKRGFKGYNIEPKTLKTPLKRFVNTGS
jgi:hypothetical protein